MGFTTHLLLLVGLINVLISLGQSTETESLLIQTKSGPIQGTTTHTYSGQEVSVFYAIPYANPPIGKLRFQPPVHVSPWTEVFQADKKPCPCNQYIHKELEEEFKKFNGSIEAPWCEDCLTLNIWVPKPAPVKAAVVVHIHGGGFSLGSSMHFFAEGHTLADVEKLVMVSINYRLSVFGFLKLPDPATPGNAGLMDQQLALKWIHDNIESFGGDPSQVTIAGLSAGGASVGFHLLSPGSRGLFQKAIMMSGSPIDPWAIRDAEDVVKTSLGLAQAVNCQNANVSKVVECLQSKIPEEIGEIGRDKFTLDPKHSFGPSVDGTFITEHPKVSVEAGRFNDADLLIGVVSDEGHTMMGIMTKNLAGEDGSLTSDMFDQALKPLFPTSDIQREAIRNFYTDWTNSEDPHMFRNNFAQLLGDFLFVCGTNNFANGFFRTGNNVYHYVFDETFRAPGAPGWGGASHGSDAAFTTGAATARPGHGAELSKAFMHFFGNFARTGNPNPTVANWPKYSEGRRQYMKLNLNMSVATHHKAQECAFWDHLFPLLPENEKQCS